MRRLTLLAGILWAILCSYIVYFGFTTNYTVDTFSPSTFQTQYMHGVYRYRVLSNSLLLQLDRGLVGVIPDSDTEPRLLQQDPKATKRFYYAYYLMNSFFLVLTAIALYFLLYLRGGLVLGEGERVLLLFFTIALISLTQFVICPYDISSYFFELAAFYIFLRFIGRKYWPTMLLVSGMVVLATLNRESSAMIVAFVATLLFFRYGWSQRFISGTLLVGLAFLVTYVGLRVVLGADTPVPGTVAGTGPTAFHYPLIYFNFTLIRNLMGILFWFLMFYLGIAIANTSKNRDAICIFYLVCLPYICQCLVKGIMWELRLGLPLLLGGIVVSKLDMSDYSWPAGKWTLKRIITRESWR